MNKLEYENNVMEAVQYVRLAWYTLKERNLRYLYKNAPRDLQSYKDDPGLFLGWCTALCYIVYKKEGFKYVEEFTKDMLWNYREYDNRDILDVIRRTLNIDDEGYIDWGGHTHYYEFEYNPTIRRLLKLK